MKQTAIWLTPVFMLVLVRLCPAGTMADAAQALPGEVLAALLVGDLKQADADYRLVLDGMGVTDLVPESQREPLARLKEKLPGLTGFDENGSLALVILKSATLPEIMANVAVLLPASDPARLLDDLGGDPVKPDDDTVRSVLLFGQTMYAAATAKHVAVARTAEVARRASRQKKTSLKDRLSAHELDSLHDLDAAVWLDTSALIAIFKPQIEGLVGWALMMQMGAGEVGEEEARSMKKQVDNMVEGLAAMLIGATLSDEGVGLRVTISTKPGSEFAGQTQHVIATAPLLRGLPRRNYLAVFGQELHPAALSAAIPGLLDPAFAELRKVAEIDAGKLDALKKESYQSLEMMRAVRGSIDHLSAGTDGMIAASLIIETTDSAAWLELMTRVGSQFAELFHEAYADSVEDDDEEENDDAPATPQERWVKWTPQAQQIEGVNVSQLFFNVLKDEELDEDDIEEIKVVLGPEPLTLRLAAVDSKNVAVTLCGGSEQMARLIRAIRRDKAPLEEETAIARAASALPREKAGIAYLALDRMVNFIHSVAEECQIDEPFPFWLPRIDAPLAISLTGGEGWSRHDIFLPMPMLEGIVSGVRTMENDDSLDEDEEIEGDEVDDENVDEDSETQKHDE